MRPFTLGSISVLRKRKSFGNSSQGTKLNGAFVKAEAQVSIAFPIVSLSMTGPRRLTRRKSLAIGRAIS
jgi:hypothetical protein